MDNKKLQELYNSNMSFKLYVDKVCNSYKITVERAFTDKIIQSYAEYILSGEQPAMAKEDNERVYRQNYGC